jgi:hypothetical protein
MKQAGRVMLIGKCPISGYWRYAYLGAMGNKVVVNGFNSAQECVDHFKLMIGFFGG